MKFTVLVVLLASLIPPALSETLGERTGINSALGIAPTTADFVKAAAISDMFVVEASNVAKRQTKGSMQAFAEKVVLDNAKLTAELTRLAQLAKAEVPYALDDAHQKILIELRVAGADEFAGRYKRSQVTEHEKAILLLERYATGGENAGIKAWAAKALPDRRRHYQMARELP